MMRQHPSHARRGVAPWSAELGEACASIPGPRLGALLPLLLHHHALSMPILRIAEHHDPCQYTAHPRLAIAGERCMSVACMVCEQWRSPCATDNASGALQLALYAAIAAAPVRMTWDMAERSAFSCRLFATTAPT